MFHEGMKLSGKLTISLNDEVVREVDNLVVTAGKGLVASRIAGNGDSAITHMEIGTDGTTAAAVGQTALQGTVLDRSAATSSVSGAVATFSTTYAAGTGTGAVAEAGLFNASANGTMLCRTVFAVVNKGAADSMTISWAVTVS